MRTTLNYTETKLNASSSATPSGSTEPVTGLQIATGTNSGDFVELTDAQALALSKTSIATLYAGIYQRVKFTAATTIALGQAVFWNPSDTTDLYCVTNVYAAGVLNNFAGVVIDTATTAGQYAWIQCNGKATVLFKASIANGSPLIGDAVILTATANTFDDPASNATFNPITMVGGFVGIALAAPASSTASLVDIKRLPTRY